MNEEKPESNENPYAYQGNEGPDASESNGSSTEAEDSVPQLGLLGALKVLNRDCKGFWLVNQVNIFDGVAYFVMLGLMTLYLTNDIGLSDSGASMSVSAFTGCVTLFMFGGGFISDRIGVRRALSLCMVVAAAGRLLVAGSASFDSGEYMAWAGLGLAAASAGVLQPALYAGIKEYASPKTVTIGFSLLYALMNGGSMLGNLVSPLIRERVGIQGVMAVMGGLTLVSLVIHQIFFSKKVESKRFVKAAPKKVEKTKGKSEGMSRGQIARFAFFIFILLPVRTLFAHQWLTIPQYVERVYPPEVFARLEWLLTINPLVIFIFVPLLASFTRKSSVLNMMLLGTSITAATSFLLMLPPGAMEAVDSAVGSVTGLFFDTPDKVNVLIAYLVLFSLGEAFWSSRFLEYVADLAPAGRVGAYMGLAGIPWFLAKFTTGLYSGRMLSAYIPKEGPQDPETMWFYYGCIATITPIGLVLARPWLMSGTRKKDKVEVENKQG